MIGYVLFCGVLSMVDTMAFPVNPVTGLQHTVAPKIKEIVPPKALLWVGNSLFFFNNGSHRFVRRLLQKVPGAPECRTNLVAIGGASLSWHDVESYFRPNAIGSYGFSNDGKNTVLFRDPNEQLWDSVLLLDSTQGPIHPQLKDNFRRFGKKDAEICRRHNATPIFVVSWAYRDRPEMTAELADSIISVANENSALAVPAGLAFAEALKRDATCPLYMPDKRHPTPAGSYLLACTVIASLFKIDVTRIDFACDINETLAKSLREIAAFTVTRFFSR